MKFRNLTHNKVVALGIPALLMALLIVAAVSVNTVNDAQADGTGGDNTASDSADDGNPGSADDSNPDSYVNHNTYTDPQPCGPGAGTAFMREPHEITTGHYALFDAYWRTISEGGAGADADGVGVLHTNLCPPEMVATTTQPGTADEGTADEENEDEENEDEETVVFTRTARDGGMDVDEIIIHVLNRHKADVVDTNAEATAGQLSLAEYTKVREVVDAGDEVWWLRLDDPGTTTGENADETSDLGIGFSRRPAGHR